MWLEDIVHLLYRLCRYDRTGCAPSGWERSRHGAVPPSHVAAWR